MVATIGLLIYSTTVLYYKLKDSEKALQSVTEDVVRLEDAQEKRLAEHTAIKSHVDSGTKSKDKHKVKVDEIISSSPNGPSIDVLREVSNEVRERALDNPRRLD